MSKEHCDDRLSESVNALAHALCSNTEQNKEQFNWLRSTAGFPTKHDLKEMEFRIMTAIETFAASMKVFTDRQDAAVAALQGDVENLEAQIKALQDSAGTVTPSDQALLDQIQARAGAISDKLDALDALTPPVAPPVA